jgi:hypothetical protein
VQLTEGLGSPEVELGVGQVRAPVIAHLGWYKFAIEHAHRRLPLGTWVCEEIEVQGPNCDCQRHIK